MLPLQDISANAGSFLKACPLLALDCIQIRAAIKTNDCGGSQAFFLVKRKAQAGPGAQLAEEVTAAAGWELVRGTSQLLAASALLLSPDSLHHTRKPLLLPSRAILWPLTSLTDTSKLAAFLPGTQMSESL